MTRNRPRALPRLATCLLLTTATLLVGCRTQPETEAPVKTKSSALPAKTAIVPYSADITGINELTTPATAVHLMLHYFALYLPLLEEQADYQTGPPTFAPRLAESYSHSDDRLAITFKLRPNVVWSDGVPITAEDVRWSHEAQTHPDVGWAYAPLKERIDRVEVVDDQTVRYHYTEVYPNQLLDATQGVILPKHAWSELPFDQWRENSQWFDEHPVFSGPFVLESHEPQQRFTLRKNERYYETDRPRIERIVFEIVSERPNRLNMLRSKEADFLEFVQYSDAESIEADPDLYLMSYIPRYFFFISWNITRPLFADARMRRALTMAIDRQTIVDSLFYGYGTVGWSPYPLDNWALNRDLEPLPYDPGEAKRLLAELGWTDSDGDGTLDKDGEPLSFELMTNSENELRKDVMVLAQEQMRRIGIAVETRTMEFNALLDPLQKQEYDGVISGLSIGTDLDLRTHYHSDSTGTNGFNWGGFSHPEVDAIFDRLPSATTTEEAKAIHDRLQVLLHEEQPVTFVYSAKRLSAANQRLQDIEPNSISGFANMRHWRLVDSD